MELAFLILILAFGLLAVERYLFRKDIEADLKQYLGDVLVARDAAPEELRVHFEAQVSVLKHLIRSHFGKL